MQPEFGLGHRLFRGQLPAVEADQGLPGFEALAFPDMNLADGAVQAAGNGGLPVGHHQHAHLLGSGLNRAYRTRPGQGLHPIQTNENGSFEDREEFDTLSRQLDEAIENEDSLKVNQIIDSLIALQVRCTPETQVLEDIKNALLYLVMFAEYKDEDESLVNDLKQKATEALENDDAMAMANIGQKLMNLAIIDPNNPGGMSAGVDRT